jgi:hypothetical protein
MPINRKLPKVGVQILETPNGDFAILETIYFIPNPGVPGQYKTKKEYDVYDVEDNHLGMFNSIEAAIEEVKHKS